MLQARGEESEESGRENMKGPTTLCEREIKEKKEAFQRQSIKSRHAVDIMPYKVAVNILRGRQKIVN